MATRTRSNALARRQSSTPRRSAATGAAQRKLMEMQSRAKAQRARAKAERDEMKTLATTVVASGALGWAESRGHLEKIPQLGGLPRLVTIAGIALVASEYTRGTLGDVAKGIGASAASVAAYQLASRGSISGASDGSVDDAVRRLANRMAAEDDDFIGEGEPVDFIIED